MWSDCATCCLDLLGGGTPGEWSGSSDSSSGGNSSDSNSSSGRQDVLLPLVHQTWLPLKLLFKSANIFLVDKVKNGYR